MLKNYIKLAWKVLKRKKLYTAVILFNIVITLSILNLILAFTNHFWGNTTVQKNFDRVLCIQDLHLYNNGNHPRNYRSSVSYPFIDKYIKTLKTPEKIGFATMFFAVDNIFQYKKGKRHKLKIRYCDNNYLEILNFKFIEGRPFTDKDIETNDLIAVIDSKTRDINFNGNNCVGKYIKIRNISHRVIGVVENVDMLKLAGYSNIWLPYTHQKHQEDFFFAGPFEVFLMAKNKNDLGLIQKELETMVSKIDFPDPERFNAIEISAEPYLYDLLKQPFGEKGSVQIILTNISLIFLVLYFWLPVINLINVNTNRIFERASEIGARKSFGATVSAITRQFIIENMFVTLIGLVISLILSVLLIIIFNSLNLIPNTTLALGWGVFIKSFICSLLLGFFSSYFPARRLAKLKIVESLYTE